MNGNSTDFTKTKSQFCSFCGKSSEEVKKLVAGPSVYICDECIALCQEILDEPAPNRDKTPGHGRFIIDSPKVIFDFLDGFVCGQNSAKRALAVAMFRHKLSIDHPTSTSSWKNNILLTGPTGSGKTYLIRSLAKLLDIPFAIVTATAYTETGYVGQDVEEMITSLVVAADGDVKRAESGIIFVDEIDKLARKEGASRSISRDVSGEGVQHAMLTLIEGAEVYVGKKIGGTRRYNEDLNKVRTDKILFVGSGAFVGLEAIVEKRIRTSSVVAAYDDSQTAESDEKKRADQLCERAIAEDFVSFGFVPEFAARFTHLIRARHLFPEDLTAILKNSKSSPLPEFEEYFWHFGIKIKFTDSFFSELAYMAFQLGTGARGLKALLTRALVPLMYSVSQWVNVRTMIVDQPVLRGELPALLSEHGIPVMRKRDKAFISYAHEDEPHLSQLLKVLAPLVRNEQVVVWSDKNIAPGKEWRSEIDAAMSAAKIAIFLVSPSFLASEYALKELSYFISVKDVEKVSVLWLLVSPCLHEESQLEKFQAVHAIDRPLSVMSEHERDELFVQVARLVKDGVLKTKSAGKGSV